MESIVFTTSIDQKLHDFLSENTFSQIAILVDENTREHCLPLITVKNALIIQINSGESYKSIDTCSAIWLELTKHQFDRKSLLINLGGGVIGDMGGFCARTYKRGIHFINIPTTLLSQVDASVGGKLGIDFNHFKNHIGLFSEPDKVLIDPTFLKTLPERELRSGYGEVIKHNLIADNQGWQKLTKDDWQKSDWIHVIKHSVNIKNTIVNNDPKERAARKSLNFGHTIGHAIESHYLESASRLLHGEAIAIGMICEAHLSYQKKTLTQDELVSITQGITSVFGKKTIDRGIYEVLLQLMSQDKKNEAGELLFVLLEGIGKVKWDVKVTDSEIIHALDYLNQI